MSRPFSARPEPVKKFEVAKSSKPLTVAQTPPMPGLARHQQATQRFEQKKRNEAKALKRRQSRGLVLRERDSNTQNLDARFEKRKAYDAELKRRQALRTVQAAQEADEAKAREEATLRRERMTPAAKGGMQFVASAKRYGRHGSLTNPDDVVDETPMGGALVDYGTPHGVPEDTYVATPVGEAAEGRIAEAVVEAC